MRTNEVCFHVDGLTQRAYAMADEAALNDLVGLGIEHEETRDFGLSHDAGGEVETLADAGLALRMAIDWLLMRGLAELRTEASGAHRVRLLDARCAEATRPPSFGPWLTPGVDPDPPADAFVLFDLSGCCQHVVGMSWGTMYSELGVANYPRPRRFCLPVEVK